MGLAPVVVRRARAPTANRLAAQVRRSLVDAASEAGTALRFLSADETPPPAATSATWRDLASELGLEVVVRVTVTVHGTGAEVVVESWRPGADVASRRHDEGPVGEIATQAGALLRATIARVRGREASVYGEPEEAYESPGNAAGRVILAGHGALFGAFAAATMLDAVSSVTARVRYPVLLIGAGVGLVAALLAHDEWDLDARQAWLVGAAMRWGVLMGVGAGIAVANDRTDRLVGGVLGGLAGVVGGGLLVGRDMSGRAIAALDSFAAWGLTLGAAIGVALRAELGDTVALPAVGGIAIGLGSGIALGRTRTASMRTLAAINGGAAMGAAISAGSVLLIAEQASASRQTRTRALGIAIGAGALLGGLSGRLVAAATRADLPARASVSVQSDVSGGSVPSFGLEGSW